MLFADFKNFKIVKEFNYTTESYCTGINTEAAVFELKKLCDDIFSRMIKHNALAVSYELELDSDSSVANEDDCNFFLGFVNVACGEFFRMMSKQERRSSDYRLDAPEKLKCLKTSFSLIKRASNYQTINDVFNLTIKYKDLIFMLCDEKTIADEKDFIHSADELEVHNA